MIPPDSRRNGRAVDRKMEKLMKRYKMMDAAKNFLNLLSNCDLDRSGTISLKEFKQAIDRVKVSKHAMILYPFQYF
jgi:Ca2+-binding EF-hand superfamily protein